MVMVVLKYNLKKHLAASALIMDAELKFFALLQANAYCAVATVAMRECSDLNKVFIALQ